MKVEQEVVEQSPEMEPVAVEAPVIKTKVPEKVEVLKQLTSKLQTKSLSIEDILNPTIKANAEDDEGALVEVNEAYTKEQFEHAWKEHALNLKRLKKDSLFATLMNSEKSINSDHQVQLILQNSIQETELNEEKGSLVRFLRQKLNNTNVDVIYSVTKEKTIRVLDSKATFDKLAEENSSLNKFRKLFNLDIEF